MSYIYVDPTFGSKKFKCCNNNNPGNMQIGANFKTYKKKEFWNDSWMENDISFLTFLSVDENISTCTIQ